MGANKSIHAGKAKVDMGVNLVQNLYSSYVLSPLRISSDPSSLANGSRFCLKLPDLFGHKDLLDILWHKGLHDSNFLITYRSPRSPNLGQRSLTILHSVSPEIGIHGIPMNNFSQSASGDLRLSKLSIGLDINEPSSSNWKTTSGVHFKRVHFTNDSGRPVSRDLDGFPVTYSGNSYDNMIVFSQESRFEEASDHRFAHLSLRVEQGIPLHPNLAGFNRFKFFASKGVKIGPAFFSTWLTGGSIVGSVAPYQAFAIGGPNSVRGYGEGAVGSGLSYVVSRSELSLPLDKELTGVIFMDFGSDLRSGLRDPGAIHDNIYHQTLVSSVNPGMRRHGKPGSGLGIGYGIRLTTQLAQIKIDCAINAFKQGTIYFGINNLVL